MSMFKKIIELKTNDDFFLITKFSDGAIKKYDVSKLLEIENFKDLKDIAGLFKQARIDTGGYGVVWNDEIDISADDIYFNDLEINI